MPIDRLRIANMERWGKLVKTWATGVNKLGDGNTYPVPQNLQDFKNQCILAGVGASVPAHVTDIQFVQSTQPTKLLLRLPPKDLVEDSEAALQQPGASYTIPDFYNRLFDRPGGPNIPSGDNMKVHAERIGDYTMSACQ